MAKVSWSNARDWHYPQSQSGVVHWPTGVYAEDEVALGYALEVGLDEHLDDKAQAVPTYHEINPHAVYVSSENKTFLVWQGRDLYIYAAYYDHDLHAFSRKIRISGDRGVEDTHGAPALVIDSNGYLHVFHGAHDSSLKYTKSDNPFDIATWSDQSDIGDNETYPNPVWANDTIYLFTRYDPDDTHPTYVRKATDIDSDGNVTWGSATEIVNGFDDGDGYRIYAGGYVPTSDGSEIIAAFTYTHEDDGKARCGIYCYRYLTSDDTIEDMAGNNVGSTLTKSEAQDSDNYFEVHAPNEGSDNQNIPKVRLDSNDDPHIIFNSDHDGTARTYYTYWDGNDWASLQTIRDVNYWDSTYDFQIISDNDFRAYIVYNPDDSDSSDRSDVGNIEYHTYDGSTWSHEGTLHDWYDNQGSLDRADDPNVVHGEGFGGDSLPDEELLVIWSENDRYPEPAGDDSDNKRVFGWGNDRLKVTAGTLLAWFPLDEESGASEFKDRSVHGLKATIVGSPTLEQTGLLGGHSVTFANGDRGEVVDKRPLVHPGESGNTEGTSAITVMAWIRKDSGFNARATIANFYEYPYGWTFEVLNDGSDENVISVYIGGLNSSRVRTTGTTDLADGEWHLVAFRHTGGTNSDGDGGTQEVLVDGTQEGSDDSNEPVEPDTSDYPLSIGNYSDNDEDYFDGQMQDLRIFNAYLSDEEIQEVYDSISSGSITTKKKTL